MHVCSTSRGKKEQVNIVYGFTPWSPCLCSLSTECNREGMHFLVVVKRAISSIIINIEHKRDAFWQLCRWKQTDTSSSLTAYFHLLGNQYEGLSLCSHGQQRSLNCVLFIISKPAMYCCFLYYFASAQRL